MRESRERGERKGGAGRREWEESGRGREGRYWRGERERRYKGREKGVKRERI